MLISVALCNPTELNLDYVDVIYLVVLIMAVVVEELLLLMMMFDEDEYGINYCYYLMNDENCVDLMDNLNLNDDDDDDDVE